VKQFLIVAKATSTLTTTIAALGGGHLFGELWIALWYGTADSLCQHLRSSCDGPIVACGLDDDWSYLLPN